MIKRNSLINKVLKMLFNLTCYKITKSIDNKFKLLSCHILRHRKNTFCKRKPVIDTLTTESSSDH